MVDVILANGLDLFGTGVVAQNYVACFTGWSASDFTAVSFHEVDSVVSFN